MKGANEKPFWNFMQQLTPSK